MEEFLINNPFVVGKYLSDKYFCDRENDTEFLRKQIVNGRNVALISPRRIGKSGLIQLSLISQISKMRIMYSMWIFMRRHLWENLFIPLEKKSTSS